MSSDPSAQSGPQPEYLGAEQATRDGGRRWAVVAAAAVGVAAVGGAGAWAVASFLTTGPTPATALPADTYAYVALDMDPAGGQKVEAWQTLRKFPALRDELGLESGDDIRRWLYEAATSGMECDVTFEDVDGWLGAKAAVAVVPDGDDAAPVGVLQVTDADAARAGMADLNACATGSPEPGLAFVDDFMVIAEETATADRVAQSAADASLADDDTHGRWLEAAGSAGVVAAYVAPSAPEAMMEQMPRMMMQGDMPMTYAGRAGAMVSPDARPDNGRGTGPGDDPFGDMPMPMAPMLPMMPMPGDLADAFDDFEGMAMVVRFADGALEGEVVTAMPDDVDLSGGASGIADLPDSTAVALGIPTGEQWVQEVLAAVETQVGADEFADGVEELEQETGLSVPGDLEALVGDGVSVAVDSSIDLTGMFGFGSTGPETFPVGIRVAGDPAEIRPALDRLLASIGPDADVVTVVDGEGAVAVGLDPAHTEALAGDGGLGDTAGFSSAMDGMDDSAGALFVDFDADDWLGRTVESEGGDDESANLEPLRSLGVSGSTDDGVARMVFRLTTD